MKFNEVQMSLSRDNGQMTSISDFSELAWILTRLELGPLCLPIEYLGVDLWGRS